jgi:hypothetical protein
MGDALVVALCATLLLVLAATWATGIYAFLMGGI